MTRNGSAGELPDAVQWHEGMLLAPQHFQQFALRTESLLHHHLAAAAPFHWGVRTLRIDEVQLRSGTFRIVELDAVMPDGLDAAYREGAGDLSLDLAGRPLDRSASLMVYLVVPTARGGAAMAAGEFARYVSYDGDPVVDINTGDGALPMPRLRPRLALLAGEAPPDKFVSLPLAEIAYQNESYARTDFVPPLLQVAPDGPLGPTCVHLVRRVREKALFLADRARAAAATAKRPLVLETQLAAQRLACALPPVEALLRAGVVHPFPLFVQCCDLLGQVAAAGTSIVPPVLDAYDHANLRDTFRQITRYVDGILDGIQEAYRPIPFRRTEAGFELALDADWLHGAALILGGVAPTGVSDADLAVWLENSLIASQAHMTSLRERRVRGPARRRVDGPDAVGLAPRRGEVLLSVAADAHYVDAGDTLLVMNPAEGQRGRPDELVLYVATRP